MGTRQGALPEQACVPSCEIAVGTVRVEELLDGIKAQIPTFQGVKFSDTDLLDLAQCINKDETGEFEFLYGVDEVRSFS